MSAPGRIRYQKPGRQNHGRNDHKYDPRLRRLWSAQKAASAGSAYGGILPDKADRGASLQRRARVTGEQ